jgi:hypothetical protein
VGNAATRKPVYCGELGGEILVTTNCFSALLRLCDAADLKSVGVDAICINQEDIPERNTQVAIMAQIYRHAKRVIIYVGEPADDSGFAMQYLSKAQPKKSCLIRSECKSPRSYDKKEVAAARGFFARPWFTRVWVLQEVRNGDFPLVICGADSLFWRALINLATFGSPEVALGTLPTALTVREDIQSYLFGRTQTRFTAEALFQTLIKGRKCLSTDPRDKVFAIIPLLTNPIPEINGDVSGFMPDYSRSTRDTFLNLAYYLLSLGEVGGRLFYAIEDGSIIPGLPSWVPDWSVVAKAPHWYSNGFIPPANTAKSSLQKSTGIKWSASVCKLPPTSLDILGIHFDTVTEVGPTCNSDDPTWTNIVFNEWRDLALLPVRLRKFEDWIKADLKSRFYNFLSRPGPFDKIQERNFSASWVNFRQGLREGL